MKKFFAAAGVATLLMVAAPMTAEAAPAYNNGQVQQNNNSSHKNDRHNSRSDHRAPTAHRSAVVHHQSRHEFNHWRPGLERAHYSRFSAPHYHNGYYQVRAHDNHNRLVLLTISAITGAIIASSY